MSDLALANDHDLEITDGDLVICDGQDAIAQQLEIRLRFWFGEWFRNRKEGINYIRYILVKNPEEPVITALLSRVIRETPGIKSLDAFALDYNNSTRTLSVTFTCTCATGGTLTFTDFDLTKSTVVTP